MALNNIIKNKENFADEETWWKIWEDEVSGKEKAHSEISESKSKMREKILFQKKKVNLSMVDEI